MKNVWRQNTCKNIPVRNDTDTWNIVGKTRVLYDYCTSCNAVKVFLLSFHHFLHLYLNKLKSVIFICFLCVFLHCLSQTSCLAAEVTSGTGSITTKVSHPFEPSFYTSINCNFSLVYLAPSSKALTTIRKELRSSKFSNTIRWIDSLKPLE